MKSLAIKYINPLTLRVLYILLTLLAMALAAGAPDGFGGSGG